MNNNEIIFTLIIDLSFNKYIKKLKIDEFKKKFEIEEEKDLEDLYDDLINYEYEINEKEKKIIFDDDKEIKLEENIRLTNEEMIKELILEIKNIKKEKNELENQVYELDNIVNKDKYKNEINLIYNTEKEGECKILGDKFVKKNNNNIELDINGNKSKLVNKYKLKKGYNNIKMIFKNKIKDLGFMFDECENLENVDELKYLNIKYCKDFSYMFSDCSSLNDIKPLENWNVSNGIYFSGMFYNCSSLYDIKPLENWNVSNGNYFSNMFYNCSSLNNIKMKIKNKITNFQDMFYECDNLKNIDELKYLNIKYCNNFYCMFWGCSSLSDIKGLEKWNVSNGNNFEAMFRGCSSLSDIKVLEKWKVSKSLIKYIK